MTRITALVAAALLATPALAVEVAGPGGPKLTLNGMVDAYYTLNLTESQAYTSPSMIYAAPTGFNLGFAKLAAQAESGPAGLRLDLAFGPEGEAITADVPALQVSRIFVQQAFVSLKFAKLTLDAGRFVTPCGFEVFEAKDNWLYSHGLLFQFAMPTAHEGVRVTAPVTPEITLYGALANGGDLYRNDLGNSQSPYKTLILGASYSKEVNTAAAYLFISKDPLTTDDVFLIDATYTRTMGATAFNVSLDFGSQNGSSWFGVGGSIKHALAEDGLKIVGRIEYFDDKDAIHTGQSPLFGPAALLTTPTLFSVTGGVNYPIGTNAEVRGELRLDHASEQVYGLNTPTDNIATFTASAIAWF